MQTPSEERRDTAAVNRGREEILDVQYGVVDACTKMSGVTEYVPCMKVLASNMKCCDMKIAMHSKNTSKFSNEQDGKDTNTVISCTPCPDFAAMHD